MTKKATQRKLKEGHFYANGKNLGIIDSFEFDVKLGLLTPDVETFKFFMKNSGIYTMELKYSVPVKTRWNRLVDKIETVFQRVKFKEEDE